MMCVGVARTWTKLSDHRRHRILIVKINPEEIIENFHIEVTNGTKT